MKSEAKALFSEKTESFAVCLPKSARRSRS